MTSDRGPDSVAARNRPRLAVRAEGGPGRGSGHVARGFALAEAWLDRGGVAFLVGQDIPDAWRSRCLRAGIDVIDPSVRLDADWWALDGYDLDLEAEVVPTGAWVARIDDYGLSLRHRVDLVLDQNLGSTASDYPDVIGPILLGPRYALIRRELREAGDDVSDSEPPRTHGLRLLVSQGGEPSPSTTSFVERVVSNPVLLGIEPIVWTGSTDPMPGLVGSDLALTAAGSSVWELLLFGVPFVVYTVAPNQEAVAAALVDAGLADSAGKVPGADPTEVAGMLAELAAEPSKRAARRNGGRRVVDGLGALRVVTRMRARLVRLRRATLDDAQSIYRCNNDPVARSSSFDTAPIAWAMHLRWLSARLADPFSVVYMATDHHGSELGVVRFAIDGEQATISIALDPARRGEGWGPSVVSAACSRLCHDHTIQSVIAEVKATNTASRRAFLDADFDLESMDQGHRFCRFVLDVN